MGSRPTEPCKGMCRERGDAFVLAIVAVTLLVATLVVVHPAMFVTFFIAMLRLVVGNVIPVIPDVLNKVDPFATGAVSTTVFTPVFGMAGGHVHVNRRAAHRCPIHDSRLRIDDLWLRVAADIDPSVKAGLAHADGSTDVVGEGRKGGASQCGREE